ncbi:hypothetical protein ABBQ32_003656 [Trebouxia sp. C0010 RCD-2024]
MYLQKMRGLLWSVCSQDASCETCVALQSSALCCLYCAVLSGEGRREGSGRVCVLHQPGGAKVPPASPTGMSLLCTSTCEAALTAEYFGPLAAFQCLSAAGTTSRFDEGPPESPHISLLSPELQQQWHDDSNMHLGAVKVKPYSNIKAVWKRATSKITQSQPTFAEAQPAELAEWDHKRNEAEGFYPHLVTLGSGQQVRWICSRCPAGQPHRWTATAAQRVGNGTRCAVCNGRKSCVCNSLESDSVFPSIAAEFDVDKNSLTPCEVSAWSNKKVWWSNAKRGSWRQAVHICTERRLPSNTQHV